MTSDLIFRIHDEMKLVQAQRLPTSRVSSTGYWNANHAEILVTCSVRLDLVKAEQSAQAAKILALQAGVSELSGRQDFTQREVAQLRGDVLQIGAQSDASVSFAVIALAVTLSVSTDCLNLRPGVLLIWNPGYRISHEGWTPRNLRGSPRS